MALFALLFLVVALILIGVGIVIGAIVSCVAAVLVALGVLSSSVVIGLLTRRPVAAVRAFLFQSALLAGIPLGILCAWLVHYIASTGGPGWLVAIYGALGGALAGLVIAFLLDFAFRRLHRWGTAKLGSAKHREIATEVT